MLEELAALRAGDRRGDARAAVAGRKTDLGFLVLDKEAFAKAPKKSIDYAVMERTQRAAVLAGRRRLVGRRPLVDASGG